MYRNLSRLHYYVLIFFIASLLLTACGGGGEEDPATQNLTTGETENDPTEETTIVDSDPEPTDEPEPEPTDTPEPEPTDTPEPEPMDTPESDPAADFTEFTSEVGGVTFNHPSEWVVEDAFGFILLVSDESLLEADILGQEGAGMVFASGPIDELGVDQTDLETALLESSTEFGFGEEIEVIEPPTLLTINGQDAARLVMELVEEGEEITGVLYIITANGRAAVAFGLSPRNSADTNIPTFDAIANTIVLSEPVADLTDTIINNIDMDLDLSQLDGILLSGDVMNGTITEAGQSVWNFTGISGEAVDIVVEPMSSDLDIVVDVVNADGESVLADGPVDNSLGTEQISDLAVPETGSYYIVVTGYESSDTGEIQISLSEAGSETTENNSDSTFSFDEGIAYGSSILGSMTIVNPTPSFPFSGSAGDIITLIVEPFGDEVDPVLDIVDSLGNSIMFGGTDNSLGYGEEGIEIVMAELPESGDYSVVISPYEDDNIVAAYGDFNLALNGPDGSLIIAKDTLEEGDEHAFPFTAAAGEIVNLVVVPEGDLDVIVQIFDDNTQEEIVTVDRSLFNEGLGFIVPEDGNYYYLISGFTPGDEEVAGGESTGDYTAYLYSTDLVLSEITTGDTIRGVFSADDGIIEFIYNASANDTLNLTLDVAEGLDGVITLFDLDDNLLGEVDDGVSGDSEVLSYTAPTDDLVVIRVSEFFGDSGAFALTVE